jgi:hypothetical protein
MQHQRRRDELVRQVAELELKKGVGTAPVENHTGPAGEEAVIG